MAHFAELDENNIVINVIVIDNDHAPDPAPEFSETLGIQYITSMPPEGLGLSGNWVQTSYNGSFRKQYAGIGYYYNQDNDIFIAPQPYQSWSLDENFDWQPPVPRPETSGSWIWDEDSLSWIDTMPEQTIALNDPVND